MLKNKRVRLDEIMPDPNNPRTDFEGLDELAASFAYTPERPGEPYTPIIVVQDGNRYRIVDGERRYQAMCAAGKVTSCLCSVADSLDEANSVAMMMATDDKKTLTSEERSQGVQQMLILGVDFEKVDGLGKLESGSAKRIKRALSTRREAGAAAKPVQTDLNTLMEIAEIENPHRMGQLISMLDEGDAEDAQRWGSPFRRQLRIYKAEKLSLEAKAAIARALEAHGIAQVETQEPPEGYMEVRAIFINDDPEEELEELFGDGYDPSELKAHIELGGRPEDTDEYGNVTATRAYVFATREAVVRVEGDDGAGDGDALQDPEALARKRERDEFASELEHSVQSRFNWLISKARDLDGSPAGKALLQGATRMLRSRFDKEVMEALKKDGLWPIGYVPWMAALEGPLTDLGLLYFDDWSILRGVFEPRPADSWLLKHRIDAMQTQIDSLDTLIASGYEASEWEIAASERMSAVIESWAEPEEAESEGEEGAEAA